MTEATLTFRVDADLKDSFANAAKGRDRTAAQLLRDFMRDYVSQQLQQSEHDAWFRAQVRAGIEAADAGDWVSSSEVEAEATVWRKQIARKPSGAGA